MAYAGTMLRRATPQVILATDHGYFGVVRGLERPRSVLAPLLDHADVLMADLRVLHAVNDLVPNATPIILRASGGGSTIDIPVAGYKQEPARMAYHERTGTNPHDAMLAYEKRIGAGDDLTSDEWDDYNLVRSIFFEPDTLADENLILTPDDIKRAGAHAAAVSAYVGSPYQSKTLDNLATMYRLSREAGIGLLGVVAVGKGLGFKEKDPDYLMRAGAIVAAHGADVIKIYNCGEGFKDVVDACVVPVVVAGGKVPKGADPVTNTLELARHSIECGARGLDFGRRVWRDAHPVAMIRALKDVASGMDSEQAAKNYHEYANE